MSRVDEVRVTVKRTDGTRVKFAQLSEGEQQLLTVLGLLLFTQNDEALYLLDEPDTHLNPVWTYEYLALLQENIRADKGQLVVATHNPLMIGSLHRNQVRVLSNEKDGVAAREPDYDPIGVGVEGLLKSELYGLRSTLAPEILEKLDRHYLLLGRTQRTAIEQGELMNLAQELNSLFCATDMTFGVNWVFSRARVGSYKAAYIYPNDDSPGAKSMTIAKAITASACFPPLFGPMKIVNPRNMLPRNPAHSDGARILPETIALTDGGVYDNMAIEPVWKKAATVLVSDCGAPFMFVEGRPPWRSLLRYNEVLSRQTQSLRIRALQGVWKRESSVRAFDGTRWHLASGRSEKSPVGSEGYSEDLAKQYIAAIRTDLDNFSDGEMCILENHGYFNADYRLRYEFPLLLESCEDPESLRPKAPYPDWMDEVRIIEALKNSHRRFFPSRLWHGLFA